MIDNSKLVDSNPNQVEENKSENNNSQLKDPKNNKTSFSYKFKKRKIFNLILLSLMMIILILSIIININQYKKIKEITEFNNQLIEEFNKTNSKQENTPYEKDNKKDKVNSFLNISLPLFNKTYIISFESTNSSIILTAEEEFGLELYFYKIKMEYEDFIKLGKMFRVCENIEEIKDLFKVYIAKAIKQENKQEIKLIIKNDYELDLYMKVLVIDKQYSFSIKLKKIQKDLEKLIIDIRRIVNVCIEKYGKEEIFFLLRKNISISNNTLIKNYFRWKELPNYELDQSKLIATHIGQRCSAIIGDRYLPKEKVVSWKIRLNHFTNTLNLVIGVAPYNIELKEPECFYSIMGFDCCISRLMKKGPTLYEYREQEYKSLNEGDIIEVTVDISKGELSYSVNEEDYGIAFSDIPSNIDIVPAAIVCEKNATIELL